MYCRNCGAKLSDDSAFCGDCGAKVIRTNPAVERNSMETPIYNPVVNSPAVRKPSKGNRKIIFLIAGFVVICLLAIFILIRVVTNNSPRSVAEKLVEYLNTGDAELYYSTIIFEDDLISNSGCTLEELIEKKKKVWNDWKNGYCDYDGNYSDEVSQTFIDSDISSIKKFSKDQLQELISYHKEWLNITVSDARNVAINIKYKDSDGNIQTETEHFVLIKVDGKWYSTVNGIVDVD